MMPRGAAAALALSATLLLAGAAKRDPLEGRVAGAPQHCIDTFSSNTGATAFDDHTIVYRESGRRLWVSHPQGACPSLRPLTTLIIERQQGSQLCDFDRFRVLAPGQIIPSAYCRFGPFVPYDKPGR